MVAQPPAPNVRFDPSEITIHFDDTDASREAIDAAKRLGFDVDLTPLQLTKLRGRTSELRAWIRKHPERIEAFVHDPEAVLDTIVGVKLRAPSKRQRPTAVPRWSGAGGTAEIAAAGVELQQWALAEPGRLARFLKDPASVVDAALSNRSPAFRKRVAAALTPPQPARPKKTSRGRTRR